MELTIPPCEAIVRSASKRTQNYQEPGLCFFGRFLSHRQKKSSGAIFHRFPSERPWVGHNGPPQKRADSQFTHSQSTTPPPIPAGPRWRKDREIDAWKMVTISAFFTTGSWIPSLKIRREDTPILYKVAGRYDYKKNPSSSGYKMKE